MKAISKSTAQSHKYELLADHFREQIRSGLLKPGDRLPSFGQMMADHKVGQGTLERTYALLEDEQMIVREPNRGTFVAETKRRARLGVVGVLAAKAQRYVPYYAHLLEGIQDVAAEEKIEILLLHDASLIKWEKMDGVIFTGAPVFTPSTVPAVNLVRRTGESISVTADDFDGAKKATEHLISLGHRRIAFLVLGGRNPLDSIIEDRLRGYRAALQEAGIKPRADWIRPLRDDREGMKSFTDLGYEKMTRWLKDDWAALGCTAILAHNDHTAVGIIRALNEAGIDVPGEISVVGFDGTEIADHMRPALTTVVVPLYEIGATGMRFILQQISGGAGDVGKNSVERLLPTRLKIQDSTAVHKTKS